MLLLNEEHEVFGDRSS